MKLLQYIKRWLISRDTQRIILLFVTWKVLVLVFAYLGVSFLPLRSPHFFGGGLENYLEHPLFWGWSNFDGEHYLAIAQYGYKTQQHSFFPLYPFLVRLFAPDSLSSLLLIGLFLSNLTLFIAIFVFFKLVKLDFGQHVAWLGVLTLLAFPTSFFLGSFYTESLFLLLTLIAFYGTRSRKWLLAGLSGGLASATRVFGIFLFPALLFEWWGKKGKGFVFLFQLFFIFLVPLGFLVYTLYLYKATGNPLAFYSELSSFGPQRQEEKIILLYQVFWRYARMLILVPKTDPIYLTVLIEAVVGLAGLTLLLWGYLRKIRFSYLFFAAGGYLIPTFTGSFSSLPRYILVLFPFFILIALFLQTRSRKFQVAYFIASLVFLALQSMFFIRGYWVA